MLAAQRQCAEPSTKCAAAVPWQVCVCRAFSAAALVVPQVQLWELLDAFQVGRTHLHSIMLYLIRNHRVVCSDGSTSDGACAAGLCGRVSCLTHATYTGQQWDVCVRVCITGRV